MAEEEQAALQQTPEGYPFYGPQPKTGALPPVPPPPGFQPIEGGAPPPPPAGFQPIGKEPTPPPGFQPTEQPKAEEKPPANFADYLFQAIEPITSYPATQREMAKESVEQMGKGVEQLGTPGERLTGAANVGLGALGYVASPISAGLRSVAGRPIERMTGLPKEYTEFTLGLALPGVGMAPLPKAMQPAAKAVQKAFAPETVSPAAQDAAALIRQHTGEAARATEQTGAQLESYYKPIAQLPKPDQWNIMNYVDGGANAVTPPTPQLRSFADTLKDAFDKRKIQLKALPKYAQREFLEDYFPHFWKDPSAAKNFVESWGGGIGKQGSGASLKARIIPTFEEGIARGLEPLYDNPIDATMRYVMSMDKFIAANKILDEGVASGLVIKATPKIMGASGRPGAMVGVPPGYVELAGRGGQGHFAPENWALIYNNWLSPGFERLPGVGNIYEAARKFTNTMTGTLLGFSGYHAFTMAEAAMGTELARAVQAARNMKPGEFTKAVGRWATTPIRYAYRGKKFKDMYLHPRMAISPEDREIVDLITQAGGRMVGTKHTLDYQMSALGDYLTSFRRAKLGSELAEQMRGIRQAPLSGTAKFVLSNLARVMETFNKPLFQHYIPSVKNGAAAELVGDWLKANPGAGQTEKLAAARRIVDSVDNRFGEMIQDNIFWNKMLKQSAMLSMLSYSWNMGGWREIGGGLRDIARTAVGRSAWTPKADYVVSTAINWSLLSAIYQYAKTGQKPTDTDTPLRDLMAPRTGGVDSRSGQPERIIVPGIMKDVFGYYEHPMQEVVNKLNPGMKMMGQLLSNRNWRDDPIFAPETSEEQGIWDMMPEWLGNLFEYIGKTASPITFQNIGRVERGSALSPPERALGIRTAPRFFVDPQGYETMIQRMKTKQWYGVRGRGGKLGHEAAEEQRYQGPD